MSMQRIARWGATAKGWLLPTAGSHDSEEAEEMRRWAIFGILTVIIASLIVTAWAVWAPLHGAVLGQGMLKVESYRQTVQHQEGGWSRKSAFATAAGSRRATSSSLSRTCGSTPAWTS
jgi:hypothetical protein